jgi:ATP-dependent DNA ligase
MCGLCFAGGMSLPLSPPVLPQLARSAKALPAGEGWSYEPKWDGFRSIAFVDGADVYLQSRNGKPLTRYFPELSFPDGRYVLDGEIVLFDEQGRQDFDALGQRIHPAESRIRMLAEATPTRFVAFDVLAIEDDVLLELSQHERRARLERLVDAPVDLTPVVYEPDAAQEWLQQAEGVIAKQLDARYCPGERVGMVKVKRVRTIDAVVMGWRPGKEEGTVGSFILGLHDENGNLRPVGHTSGFSAKEKRELPARLAPYETGKRGMGDPSRWANDRELEWIELRPELVVEVTFDHTSNDRIRHGAKIARWREDKPPAECRTDQLLS